MGAKDFAVVVGINDYPHYRSLVGAREDAADVASWLTDKNGGNLPEANCHLVQSRADPLEPIQDQIDSAFANIYSALPDADGRRLYFYFGGHGLGAGVDDVSLCLAKWSSFWRRTSLSHREYKNELRQSGLFSQVVFWLDCCRVRSFNVAGHAPTFGEPGPERRVVREFVAFATDFQDPAFESDRGVFTRALLNGLRGGAADVAGNVTSASLKNHLEVETPRLAATLGKVQVAEVNNGFTPGQDDAFGPTIARLETQVTIELSDERGEVVLEGPMLDEIARWPAGAGGKHVVSLARGAHVLRETSTGKELVLRGRFEREGAVNVIHF